MMQLRIGDAPADRVLSFEVTLGPITLTSSAGTSVTVLTGSKRLELSHLSATNELLAMLKVPQGAYTNGSITVSNPEITFIDSTGKMQKLEPAFNQAIPVSFDPPVAISASATVLSIDLNIAKSLTFDAQGNITGLRLSGASFTIGAATVGREEHQDDHDGAIEGLTGVISAVGGPVFDLTIDATGITLRFTSDANTRFDDGATLTVSARVTVEGFTRSDGSLYAKEIEAVDLQQQNQQAAEAEGYVTHVTGSPATQLAFLAVDGGGNGMDSSHIGGIITADVASARYRVHAQDIDTNGVGNLPSAQFPFDANSIHAGQLVQVSTNGSMKDDVMRNDDDGGNGGNDGNGGNGNDGGNNGNGGNGNAARVELQQQTLTGGVSGLSATTTAGPATFTLTLPDDSIFAMLSGETAVSVYLQPGTDLHDVSAIANGDRVRVRGLVFFNGTSFTMIAGRVTH